MPKGRRTRRPKNILTEAASWRPLLVEGLAVLLAVLCAAGCAGAQKQPHPKLPPDSIVLTVHPDGTYSEGRKVLSRDDLDARIPPPSENPKSLWQCPRDARLRDMEKLLLDLFHLDCVNLTFEISHNERVRFPAVLALGDGSLRIHDGTEEVILGQHQKVLELVVRAGKAGAIQVERVDYTRQFVFFPEKPGDPIPDFSWKGEHPPYGIWTEATLLEFMARPDVASQTPYVGLEISWDDSLADVLHCLQSLRSTIGNRVEPILRPRN